MNNDNMAYLQQISVSSRPPASGKRSLLDFFTPRNLIIVGVIAAALLFITFISNLLGGVSDLSRDTAIQSELRTTNLITTINNYNSYLKSSTLRSMSNSLLNVLSETSRDLSPILLESYQYEDSEDAPSSVLETETANFATLNNTLETARLNALLDRTYTREFTLQIALLIAIESEASQRTSDTNLQNVLTTSINNLQILHNEFEAYQDIAN